MTFLPIVARELRVGSRRRGTYWIRSSAALVVITLGVWLYVMMRNDPAKEIASALFWTLAASAVLYALLGGGLATADCLSQEKREGTLGLLFLTDLKGYDVVLGKLVASSVNAFYGVLAVLPMLAVPLLMGGIAAPEFWRMALLALNALFFSLALGLGVSTLSRSAQKATMMTVLLLLFFTAVLPWCGALLRQLRPAGEWAQWVSLPSVGYSYFFALERSYKASRAQYWYSLLVCHGLAWAFLALASAIAPRVWQDKSPGVGILRWRERWQQWKFGDSAERAAFRRRSLDQNAFFWLASRVRLQPVAIWVFLGVLGCGWLLGWVKWRRDWLNDATYVVTALSLNLVLRWWFAGAAVRQLAEERQGGTLELLLSTPLRVRDILRGQRQALQRQFLGPALAVLAVECLLMVGTVSETLVVEDRVLWVSLWLGGMLMLVMDIVALYWVGMWQGLTARNVVRATHASLARILACPWGLFALVIFLGVLGSVSGTAPPQPGWKFWFGLWFFLGLLCDFGFAAYARQKLLSEFRVAAQQRYAPARRLWKGLRLGQATRVRQ